MEPSTVNLEIISKQLFWILPEKERRLFAAYQALERLSINAIIPGQAELKANTMVASGHQRRRKGGLGKRTHRKTKTMGEHTD
jgi:hypothetical protein